VDGLATEKAWLPNLVLVRTNVTAPLVEKTQLASAGFGGGKTGH